MILRLLLLATAFLLVGCSPDQEDESALAGPAAVAFDGKVDPSLAGNWQTSGGNSVLKLDEDGSLQIESTFNTPNGKQSTAKRGKWLSTGEHLKLQYEESDGSILTISYTLRVESDKMVLSTKTPKRETTYTRN